MLKRKAMRILEEWNKNSSGTALCLLGARQTGKTTLVQNFAAENFEVFLKLDFLEDQEARSIFENAKNTEDILTGMMAFSKQKLVPGKTLILFDEIQECPQARTAVKYLVQDGRFRYIETGSLLGVKIREIKSLPVGFEQLVSIYPLDFEEFCWAMNLQNEVIERLRDCFEQEKPVPLAVHNRMLELFSIYSAVGGMPEAVQAFVDTRDIQIVSAVQRRILDLYKLDIAQYTAPEERLKVQDIFTSIPSQLNEKNIRFFLSAANPNARLNRYESSLVWLIESGTVLPSYSVSQPAIPLALNSRRNQFRLFLCDSGLLCAALGEGIAARILMKDHAVDLGAVFENLFAQILSAADYRLYYYNSKKIGEIDFVVEQDARVLLIEIKSGEDYERHRSLTKVLEEPNWLSAQAVVFCKDPGKRVGRIRYLPWYMSMFLHERKALPVSIEDFNWESLSFPEEGTV